MTESPAGGMTHAVTVSDHSPSCLAGVRSVQCSYITRDGVLRLSYVLKRLLQSSRVKRVYWCAVAALVAVAVVVCVLAFSGEEDTSPEANSGVVGIASFDVQCNEYEGTAVSGSVFVIQDGEDVRIRLVASFSIDEDDFIGIDIYNTPQLEIESALCSYQDDPSDDEILIWLFSSERGGYTSAVMIGWNTSTRVPSGGGTGMLVVDYLYTPEDPSEAFKITIYMGCTFLSSGYIISGTTSYDVEVCPSDYL